MVDDDQPLVQVLQPVDRLLGVGVERGAEPGRHRVEPLRQHAGKLGLAARQGLAHGLHPAARLGLQPRQFGEPGIVPLPRRPAQQHIGERRHAARQQDDQHRQNEQDGFGHGGVVADSGRRGERSGNSKLLTVPDAPTTSPVMARRDIIILPDKRLRLVSKPVGKITAEIKTLVEDMFETMYDAPGIGLAAIQVGVPKRVVVMDLAKGDETPPEPRYFVNPEILWASEETAAYEEGCLSVPEIFDEVERSSKVRLRYLDYHGKAHEEEAEGLFAV